METVKICLIGKGWFRRDFHHSYLWFWHLRVRFVRSPISSPEIQIFRSSQTGKCTWKHNSKELLVIWKSSAWFTLGARLEFVLWEGWDTHVTGPFFSVTHKLDMNCDLHKALLEAVHLSPGCWVPVRPALASWPLFFLPHIRQCLPLVLFCS